MRHRALGGQRRPARDRIHARRPRFDLLEERQLLASFTVVNTNDSGAGSLRQAMIDANATGNVGGADIIAFNIPGGGFKTISPSSALPSIDEALVIDGYSQGSAVANTSPDGTNAKPQIQIVGSNIPAGSSTGFVINSKSVAISGLVVSGFKIAAISDTSLGGNALITGNFLGPTATGDVQFAGGNTTGILFQTGGNTIGGTTSFATRNLISGNVDGVILTGNGGALSTGNLIAGNLIGTTASGLTPIQNTNGVTIDLGSKANTIGGLTAQARNIVSGNLAGVRIIRDNSSANLLIGNYIGTDASGNASLSNATGVEISAPGNTIGGGSAQSRNIISGNSATGLKIDSDFSANTTSNVVAGNYIGLNVTGTSAIANGSGGGLLIQASSGNTVGGVAASLGNVIAGNNGNGVAITGISSSANVLASNKIGTNAAGTTAIANSGYGVFVLDSVSNTIGGPSATSRNIISGNVLTGVYLSGTLGGPGSFANVVAGNIIGLDTAGSAKISNGEFGVLISGTNNTIGGAAGTAGNVISGNTSEGIAILGVGGNGTVIVGNFVGTDSSGISAIGNGSPGILVSGSAAAVTIGGTSTFARNVISGNNGDGVRLTSTTGPIVVQGNYIGLDRTGSVALGNGTGGDHGGVGGNPTNATIGGTASGAGNVISGHIGAGVHFVQGSSNAIQGNRIGTNAAGTAAVPNLFGGVQLSSPNNSVGGAISGAGNLISGNGGFGVSISAAFSQGGSNLVAGNTIGLDVTGTSSIANSLGGVVLDGVSGATIGGSVVASRNIISGNGGVGVSIGGGSTGNLVASNFIGTNLTSSSAVPNTSGGITLTSSGNTIGGLSLTARNIIAGNGGAGVLISTGGTKTTVAGNFIGLSANGSTAVPNATSGVIVADADATIGGSTGAFGNVISGNTQEGVLIQAAGSRAFLGGNFLGLTQNGVAKLPNGGSGVRIQSASAVTVGGASAASRNVISGNAVDGIRITGSGNLNGLIQNNFIGSDNGGTTPAGNGVWGISIEGPSGIVVGGSSTSPNLIAFNGNSLGGASGGIGISGASASGDTLGFNNILGNIGLGIDLGEDGQTPNDPGDIDSGPNGLQNYPILQFALAGLGNTRVVGGFGSTANTNFEIQFYASDAPDGSGFGEGQFYLGSTTFATDASGSASFDVSNLAGTTAGQVVSAIAISLATGDSSEFAQDVIVANAASDLSITMTAAPNPIQAGQTLTYTITVTNNGPNAASEVSVTDILPSSVTYLSSSTTAVGGSTSFTAGVVTGNLATLESGGTATVTILVRPNTPGQVSNSATVSSVEGDTDPSNNTGTAGVTVIPSANLGVLISAAPSPVLLGQLLTYTITATNNGPSTATNVSVSDTLPAGLIFVSASTTPGSPSGSVVQNGQLITATFQSIASGQSAIVSIMASPSATGPVTNSVQVSASEADPDSKNNTASVITQVNPSANLAISATSNPAPGLVGQPFTYTITARNNGLSDANSVVITDTIPGSIAFVSASAPGASSVIRNGQTITAIFPKIVNGATGELTIVGTPTLPGKVTNHAAVSAAEGDPDLTNNSLNSDSTIVAAADIQITQTDSPDPIFVGGTLQYTLTILNSGPNQASGVVITDTLPAGVTLISVLPSQGTFSSDGKGIVTVNLGSLASGAKATAILTVRPNASAAGSINNTASVIAAEADPLTGNNTTTTSTTVIAAADLSLSIVDSPDPVPVGSDLTYTLTAANAGPSLATNVQVVNNLPAGMTLISVVAPGAFSQMGNVLTIGAGSIPSGASATITLIVRPTNLASSTVVNSASITSDIADTNGANNSASATTRVVPSSDLTISVTPDADPLLIGGLQTYTIVVGNSGPSDAEGVTIVDLFPTGAVFVSRSTPPGSSFALAADGKSATISLFSIPVGTSKTVTITLRPTTTGIITNVASVSGAQTDPNSSNSSATTSTTVNPSGDVSVSLSALPTSVLVGQPISFTADVVNHGPSASTGVTLTVNVPAGVAIANFTSSLGTASRVGQTITVTIPSLPNGGLSSLLINGLANTVGLATATATVTSGVEDPDSENNSDSATSGVIRSADLEITESVSANPAPLRAELTYNVTLTNRGPSIASNVVLTDILPVGIEFVSAITQDGVSLTPDGGVLTASIALLPVDSSLVLTIVVRPTLIGLMNNTASASADEADTVASNSTNVQLVTVAGQSGNVGLLSPTYSAKENAGVVVVTLTRTGGTDGAGSVAVSTNGGTAIPGVNYVATNINVFFADGQASQTFTIPLISDGKQTGDRTLGVVLSNPTGGISIGSPSSAVITIQDVDTSTITPSTEAPLQVTTIKRFGIHSQATQVVLTFSGALDPATATNPANYQITGSNGVTIPILSVIYNSSASTVTLTTSRQLDVHKNYRIVVRGTGQGAVATPGGKLLDGNRDNLPGGDYVATINSSILVRPGVRNRSKTTAVAAHFKASSKWAGHVTKRIGR